MTLGSAKKRSPHNRCIRDLFRFSSRREQQQPTIRSMTQPSQSSSDAPADSLVSVLIPCFNHEHYVVQALQSVADSSHGQLELVLIDDASSDGSFSAAERWLKANESRFARVVFERHTSNRGIARTMNELVTHSTGRFLAFLASDDLLVADGISKQVGFALKRDIRFVFADARLIDESGNTISNSAIHYYGRSPSHLARKSCLVVDVVFNWEMPWTKIFASAELFAEIGQFEEGLSFEDRDFIMRVISHESFALMPEPVYCYRLRRGNRLTPGLDSARMRLDYLRSENQNFRRASGFVRLLLGLNVLAGRVRFDAKGRQRRSLVWPLFAAVRRVVARAHLAAMRQRHAPVSDIQA